MKLVEKIKSVFARKDQPEHLRRGELGECAAKRHLQKIGLKFLTANFRSARGEIDLIFRDNDCLVFVEVKTRSSEDWTRPAAAVNARKRRLLSQTALDYLRRLKNPAVKIRFDIVEVLLADGAVREVRHLPNRSPWQSRIVTGETIVALCERGQNLRRSQTAATEIACANWENGTSFASSDMSQNLQLAVNIFWLTAVLGLGIWLFIRSVRRSDNRPKLILKWVLTGLVLLFVFEEVVPGFRGDDVSDMLDALMLMLICGGALAVTGETALPTFLPTGSQPL